MVLLENNRNNSGKISGNNKFPLPNPLIQILEMIPSNEIKKLQKSVNDNSDNYRYYKLQSMNSIPLKSRLLPDGKAIKHMTDFLTRRFHEGPNYAADQCDIEK